ncbi:MAG: family NAD(P)-dependent oxidoreductase [Nevskia sp.]|nr:family NAD(P)-dependent oxidoreductase [Nevskia sp.]
MSQWQVKDQVIIVAGASKGIGLATAQTLLARGAKVALLARDKERLDASVAELNSDRACGIALDVCDKAAVEQAFEAVVRRWGKIDGLINNVGFQFARRIEVMPEAEIRKLIDLNFVAALFTTQAVIPKMRANGGGRIINLSSATVRNDNEFSHLAIYSACKSAVEHFSRELRHEVKKDGIMVTVFSPGAVATGSIANFDPVAAGEAMQDWLTKGQEWDGVTQPEVIGAAIAACFELPPGVAVEFMEVRPNMPMPKMLESELEQNAKSTA